MTEKSGHSPPVYSRTTHDTRNPKALAVRSRAHLMADPAKFKLLWEQNISKLTEGVQGYMDFAGLEYIKLRILERAIEELAAEYEEGTLKRCPRLYQLKNKYRKLAGTTADPRLGTPEGCATCRHTGKVHMVTAGDTIHKLKPMIRKPRHFACMEITMIPCNCPLGHSVNEKPGGPAYPTNYLETLHEQCVFPFGQAAEVFLDQCRRLDPNWVEEVAQKPLKAIIDETIELKIPF